MGGMHIQAGERYGKLVTVERADKVIGSRMRSHWLCYCDCGNKAVVDSGNLRSGNSTQCADCARVARGVNRTRHGHTKSKAPSKAYITWQAMLARCENPRNRRYYDYGGRGITVCERWHNFVHFLDDMGEPPTADHQIDRIDNEKGYSPENCVWSTRVDQANNKRNSRMIEYQGKTQSLTLWCRELGLAYEATKARLHKGWPVEKAFTPGDARTLLHPLRASRTSE